MFTAIGANRPLLALLLFSGSPNASAPPSPEPTRVYTNDDLDRVRPLRDETGCASIPAYRPEQEVPPRSRGRNRRETDPESTDGRGETYWRREAARVQKRVTGLQQRAAKLRQRIAVREIQRRRSMARGRGSSRDEGDLAGQVEAIERQIREIEEDLFDRARRDRALPGWLR